MLTKRGHIKNVEELLKIGSYIQLANENNSVAPGRDDEILATQFTFQKVIVSSKNN